jgi:lipopolysaccharide heptosyltransferase II
MGVRVNVLVLRLSSLGDVVLSSAFLQSVAVLWPDARVTYVVRADLAAVAAALPGVQRVVAVERRMGAAGLVRLGAELGRTPWAHVFDLHQSARSRLLVAAMHRRARPGFDKQELPRFLLLHARRDVYARFGGSQPLRERMQEPLRRLGLEPPVHTTRLVLPAAARAAADAAWARAAIGEALCIGVAPGARWPTKRWPAARFAALTARLASTPGRRVVVVGSDDERALAAEVAAAAPERAAALAGTLDLLATAAVLARCAAVVTGDSGLLHVAEAVGRPVVALFGPTSPLFGYAPYRPGSILLRDPPPCSPCSKNGARPCTRPTHECMENLDVETVLGAVERTIAASARVTPT